MMNAFAAANRWTSTRFSSGVSNIQACSPAPEPSPPSSPKGRSSVWWRPAAYPSTETVMSLTTLPGRSLIAHSSARPTAARWTDGPVADILVGRRRAVDSSARGRGTDRSPQALGRTAWVRDRQGG